MNKKIFYGEEIPCYSLKERLIFSYKHDFFYRKVYYLFNIRLFSIALIATDEVIFVHKIWIKLKEKERKKLKLNELNNHNNLQ
jgi:hypothetical protein